MDKERFLSIAKKHQPKKHVLLHTFLAFLGGAIIGILGQGEFDLLTKVAGLDIKMSSTLVSITFITISVCLTILGFYKHLGQIFGAGLFIPITGFANSMASAAIEYKTEGPIYGLGSKIFSLAGSVIIYGIIGAFCYGILILLLTTFGVALPW